MNDRKSGVAEPVSTEQMWKAIQLNVNAWYERLANVNDTHSDEHFGDILLTSEHATICSEISPKQIDYMLNWYRKQPPRPVIIWYLNANPPAQLGARLLARGASPNWKPHWMWCDLSTVQTQDATHEIRVMNLDEDPIVARLAQVEPRQVWHLGAFREQKKLGKCVVNVTDFVAGLFDMEVVPEEQRKGFGTALTVAACKLAREKGCQYMVLNATEMGKSVYQRAGFQSIADGHTWHLPKSFHQQPAPTAEQVGFLEGIALGDIAKMEQFGIHEKTASGMTALELAVHCQQPRAASWLIGHGVTPDIISLWDLGWKDKARALIKEQPQVVNHREGQMNATPLHTAVERDDEELTQLLLTVPNDLSIKDGVFQSTATGWAEHLGRDEMRKLIESRDVSGRALES